MVSGADLARRLRELITALDRRRARAEDPAEAAIARDAVFLREQAVTRLADLAAQTAAAPDDRTPFPAVPRDVAVLTVHEFTFDLDELDEHQIPPIERICRMFMDDANRALVWCIRFGAWKAWCSSPDVMVRATSDSRIVRDAREVAASFPLNHRWEFDSAAFGRAVDGISLRRARTGVDSAAST